MKLEMARGLFVVGALATATVAMAAWEQPSTKILSAQNGEGHCPLPRLVKAAEVMRPDHDLLLLMYGLVQGAGPKG